MGYKLGFDRTPPDVWSQLYGDGGKVPNAPAEADEVTDVFSEYRRQIKLGNVCAEAARKRLADLLDVMKEESPERKLMDRALKIASKRGPYEHLLASLAHGEASLSGDLGPWNDAVAKFQELFHQLPVVQPELHEMKGDGPWQSHALVAALPYAERMNDPGFWDVIVGNLVKIVQSTGIYSFKYAAGEVAVVLGPAIRESRYYGVQRWCAQQLVDLGVIVYEKRQGTFDESTLEKRLEEIMERVIRARGDFSYDTQSQWYAIQDAMVDLCAKIGPSTVPVLRKKLDSYHGCYVTGPRNEYFKSDGLTLVAKLVSVFPQEFEAEARRWLDADKDGKCKSYELSHGQRELVCARCFSAMPSKVLEDAVMPIARHVDWRVRDEVWMCFIEGALRQQRIAEARKAVRELTECHTIIHALGLIKLHQMTAPLV